MQDNRVNFQPNENFKLSIDVVVPTFGRPLDIKNCLTALLRQVKTPDQLIVVVRQVDVQTIIALQEFDSLYEHLKIVYVEEPGLVASANAGLAASRSEIVAFTDDDASPSLDWLSRIEAHYRSPEVVGVGGRDIRARRADPGKFVGKVQWFGRHVGRHDADVQGWRYVDTLKGVNCSYRGEFIREVGLDTNLRGLGSQPHSEICIGAAARRRKLKLVYDPQIVVDHHEAVRAGEPGRLDFDRKKFSDEAFNESYATSLMLGRLSGPHIFGYRVLIGNRPYPGLLALPFSVRRYGFHQGTARFWLNLRSSFLGIVEGSRRSNTGR